MLIPPPEAALGQSPLVMGADVLELIKGTEGIVVEDVMLKFLDTHEASTPDDFMDTLCCLYALGVLEYESFKLREKSE